MIISRTKAMPPAAPAPASAIFASSPRIELVVSGPTGSSFVISSDSASISSGASCCMTLAARDGPSAASSTAALRAPDSATIPSPLGTGRFDPGAGGASAGSVWAEGSATLA